MATLTSGVPVINLHFLIRQISATPLLGVIIAHLPLFLIHYHTRDVSSKNIPNATVSIPNTIVSVLNATVLLAGFAPSPDTLGQPVKAVLYKKRVYMMLLFSVLGGRSSWRLAKPAMGHNASNANKQWSTQRTTIVDYDGILPEFARYSIYRTDIRVNR